MLANTPFSMGWMGTDPKDQPTLTEVRRLHTASNQALYKKIYQQAQKLLTYVNPTDTTFQAYLSQAFPFLPSLNTEFIWTNFNMKTAANQNGNFTQIEAIPWVCFNHTGVLKFYITDGWHSLNGIQIIFKNTPFFLVPPLSNLVPLKKSGLKNFPLDLFPKNIFPLPQPPIGKWKFSHSKAAPMRTQLTIIMQLEKIEKSNPTSPKFLNACIQTTLASASLLCLDENIFNV